jgi:hypothetical protein
MLELLKSSLSDHTCSWPTEVSKLRIRCTGPNWTWRAGTRALGSEGVGLQDGEVLAFYALVITGLAICPACEIGNSCLRCIVACSA